MKVPFNDLSRIHNPLREELDAAWKRIVYNHSFILGKEVETFENNFALYCGLENFMHAAGLGSGMDALELALHSLGIKHGDEIIVPAFTFNATASAVKNIGAIPIFVDVDKETYLINTGEIKNKITEKTKAIIPVHLYGQMADMKKISEIAKKHNLFVVEDACQCHGAHQNGIKPGQLSDAAAFSFYPGKNLGAFGDGGIVISKNQELIKKIKQYRNYGQKEKYYHEVQGFNKRLDGIQAAILDVKLKHLDSWNKNRLGIAKKYTEKLSSVGDILTPKIVEGNEHVFHLYVIQTHQRDKLQKFLSENGIDTGIHYPIPLHQQNAFSYLNSENNFPITEEISKKILSLPIFPYMTDEEINYVCEKIGGFFERTK